MYDTDHKQVPFTTLDGELTEVDEGMFDVLTRLKEMGVRTYYSCQGGEDLQPAYVAGDAKSFKPVLKEMRRRYKKRAYSQRSMKLANLLFRNGYERLLSLAFYRENIDNVFEFQLKIKRRKPRPYVIERIYGNKFGQRTVFRWAPEAMDDFLNLLYETRMNPYSLRRRKDAIRENSRRRRQREI